MVHSKTYKWSITSAHLAKLQALNAAYIEYQVISTIQYTQFSALDSFAAYNIDEFPYGFARPIHCHIRHVTVFLQ